MGAVHICHDFYPEDYIEEIDDETLLSEARKRDLALQGVGLWDSDLEELDAAVSNHDWPRARTILDRYKHSRETSEAEIAMVLQRRASSAAPPEAD
jgi:hypothetical protein